MLVITVPIIAQNNNNTVRALILNTEDNTVNARTPRLAEASKYLTTEIRRQILSTKLFNIVADNNKLEVLVAKQALSWQYDKTKIVEYGKQLGAEVAIIPIIIQNNIESNNDNHLRFGQTTAQSSEKYTLGLTLEVYDLTTQQLLTSISSTKTKEKVHLVVSTDDGIYSGDPFNSDDILMTLCNSITSDIITNLRYKVVGLMQFSGKPAEGEKIKKDGLVIIDAGYDNNIAVGDKAKFYCLDKNGFLEELGVLEVQQVQTSRSLSRITEINNEKDKISNLIITIETDSIVTPIIERRTAKDLEGFDILF